LGAPTGTELLLGDDAKPLPPSVAATERLTREAGLAAERRARRAEAAACAEAARFSFNPRISANSERIVEHKLRALGAADPTALPRAERHRLMNQLHRAGVKRPATGAD